MKKRLSNVIIILMLIVGLSLLLYPGFSNYWNSLRQSRVITDYLQAVNKIDKQSYDDILHSAQEYNEKLYAGGYTLTLNDEQRAEYEKQLDILGNGMMGYIEIPKIGCFLPVYHGTTDAVLQVAVGHVEGSSLPIGGESTHAVLSGHRGLPSSVLFTDLDQIAIGDTFFIQILNETLTYEVDQIRTVLPHEMEFLTVEEGMDYCTLMTCTPYGINTHRLLVRGHRVINDEEESHKIRITGDALIIKPLTITPLVVSPILIIFLMLLIIRAGKVRKKEKIKRAKRK